jgi:hypothetical protein
MTFTEGVEMRFLHLRCAQWVMDYVTPVAEAHGAPPALGVEVKGPCLRACEHHMQGCRQRHTSQNHTLAVRVAQVAAQAAVNNFGNAVHS